MRPAPAVIFAAFASAVAAGSNKSGPSWLGRYQSKRADRHPIRGLELDKRQDCPPGADDGVAQQIVTVTEQRVSTIYAPAGSQPTLAPAPPAPVAPGTTFETLTGESGEVITLTFVGLSF